jgi:hypothetical protein
MVDHCCQQMASDTTSAHLSWSRWEVEWFLWVGTHRNICTKMYYTYTRTMLINMDSKLRICTPRQQKWYEIRQQKCIYNYLQEQNKDAHIMKPFQIIYVPFWFWRRKFITF